MLHQNYTGFQMASIPLHTLLLLWLFVYRCTVNKSMKDLCEAVYPSYTDTFRLTPTPKVNLSQNSFGNELIPFKSYSAEQWLFYYFTAHRRILGQTHAAVTAPGSWESPQYKEDVEALQQIQWGPQGWWRGWNIHHLSRSWEVGLFNLEKRGFSGILSMCLTTWWGGSKEHTARLFSTVPGDGTRGLGTDWNTGKYV